jgi:hypothetical protein
VVISLFVVVLFYFQWGLHKLRDWIASPNKSKVESDDNNQELAFEPLASTINGGSHFTFGEKSVISAAKSTKSVKSYIS